MKHQPPTDHHQRLSGIRSIWRRLLVSLLINCLLLLSKLQSKRARVHWAGYLRRHPRRERLLFLFLALGPILVLEINQMFAWVIAWGSTASLFVIIVSVIKLIPRRRAHWIGL